MDIKRIAIDAVNEIIEMTVVNMDYKGQVQKRLNEKMPLATVKGFRKGQVPRALVEKQYGRDIKIEEVKKVVELALSRYINSQNMPILGSPIFKENPDFDWQAEELKFEYEIGLVPEFELDFEKIPAVIKYEIQLDQKVIDAEIKKIQTDYGTANVHETIENDCEIEALFENSAYNIAETNTFYLHEIDFSATSALFLGKKVGEKVIVNSKQIYSDPHDLMHFLKVSHDIVHDLDVAIEVTIQSINKIEPAVMDQAFFENVFGPGVVSSKEEMESLFSQNFLSQYSGIQQNKFGQDAIDAIINHTKIDLPKDFLIKWMAQNHKIKLSPEKALDEYNRAENGLRLQLIESRFGYNNEQKVTFEDLKLYTTSMVFDNMRQYSHQATSTEVEGIVARILTNKDEVARLTKEVHKQKTLQAMIEKVKFESEKVSYSTFRDHTLHN